MFITEYTFIHFIQLALKLLRVSQSSYLFSLFQMDCDQMEISAPKG